MPFSLDPGCGGLYRNSLLTVPPKNAGRPWKKMCCNAGVDSFNCRAKSSFMSAFLGMSVVFNACGVRATSGALTLRIYRGMQDLMLIVESSAFKHLLVGIG